MKYWKIMKNYKIIFMNMKLLNLLISLLTLAFVPSCSQSDLNEYQNLQKGFENPTGVARPKVYWWCLNGNIDTIQAKQEFLEMKKTGITGFDFFEIGVRQTDTMIPAGPAFLSDESLQVIKFVVREAGNLGLDMGLNLSSSWNAGGAWTKPENAGKSLYSSKINVKGNSGVQEIKVPFPEISFPKSALIGGTGKPMIPFRADGKPEYFEEVAILAIPANTAKHNLDTSRVINVTQFFDSNTDLLTWNAPQGDWEILRYVCSNSGQQLVLPSTHSAGLTIDHFDSTAVETHLLYVINRLKTVLGDDFRKTALKSLYLASYEARGFVWTSSLSAEFKKMHGYDIYKFLPSFFNPEIFSSETTQNVQTDFKKTLSELMINNLYKKAQEICHNYGLKINCEAGGPGFPLYNGPSEPLKALGSLDIPRGEFWVNHSKYYKDSNSNDSIDVLRVVKEVSAASHIYQKGIVEMEAFTSFQHWQEGPFDIKPFGDRAFAEGMNRVVFHGFSHNPAGTGFPGIVYHAGTHFNSKRVWWPKIKPFVDYLSRLSFIFQQTDFVSDVLWYYGDKVPNAGTPKNTHFVVGPGYDYEIVNTEILLNGLTVKNGKLVLSNGAQFSVLALENEEAINPQVLAKLQELSGQGAKIVGARPEKASGLENKPEIGAEKKQIITQLWTDEKDPSKVKDGNKGKIYQSLKPIEMLNILEVTPDFDYADKDSWLLDFIHYRKNDLDFYFITNTSNQWVSRYCSFRQQSKVPEIWNPLTGEIVPISIYDQNGKYLEIPLSFPPYGSYLVAFKSQKATHHYNSVKVQNSNPPLLEYTNNGLQFLENGIFNLVKNGKPEVINNNIIVDKIEGSWKLDFPKNWGAPDSATFPSLISWTESEDIGIKYFSGIATYHKKFNYTIKLAGSKGDRIYLDLGDISKIAEVWLNGKPLGITWTKPYKFDITEAIKNGENVLKIEVANTWSNRIVGDALTGTKFTNTNIKISRTGIPWENSPLIKSGLLGPVSIQKVKAIKL